MIVQHFDIHTPKTKPPQEHGWEPSRYGYYWMSKCLTPQRKREIAETFKEVIISGETHELDFENDCFLSILADIKQDEVNFFELGAGWGDWCLALAGIIDFKIIPIKPKTYRCLAVEGEPVHCQWTKEHFEIQKINGEVVHGAVSNENGVCHFSIHAAPDTNYGQAIIPSSKLSIRKVIGNIYTKLLGRSVEIPTIEVPMYSVDYLIQKYKFNHVDVIHMDVQGSEYEVVQGASKSIENDLIDYFLIGVHDKKTSMKLMKLLRSKFDLIVNIYPNSLGKVPGFAPIRCDDGMQLYRRKNI